MKIKKWVAVFLFALMLGVFPTLAYAADSDPTPAPVEKVTVHFWMMGSQGQWVPAQGDWTAVKGGSKKMSYYNIPAQNNSPLSVGNTTYTFNNSWVDDFGNVYQAEDVRLQGSDFITLFAGYTGPTATLNVYAQYTVSQDYYFHGNWIDNVANGGGSESHIVNYNTGYTHTFHTPLDISTRYSFLYWDGGDYGQFTDGSTFEISAGNLGGDLYADFVATYEYTPVSMVKVIYEVDGEIIYETPASTEPINIRQNAPTLNNGQWLFNICPCVGEEAVPDIVDPIITTAKIEDEPVIKTVYVYGVLNGTDGKDGTDGKNGIDGIDGIDGKDGVDGKDGKDGVDGTDGVNGVDGKDGKDGADGVDGKDGLNGSDGIQGAIGPVGHVGPAGINGADGVTTIRYASTPTSVISSTNPFALNGSTITANTLPTKGIGTSTQTIEDNPNALTSGTDKTSHWGLLNLIFMIISLITVFIPIIFRKKNTENYNKIIIALFAIAAIVIFVLTENILLPMAFIDPWTWLMGIICLCSIILVIVSYFNKKKTVEE